jgi:hypothetical protein
MGGRGLLALVVVVVLALDLGPPPTSFKLV